MFGKPLRWLMPDEDYLAGMGIVVAVALVFGVGLLMHGVLFRKLFRRVERAMLSVPLVRSIYGAMKDLLGLFGEHKDPALQVVSLTLPGTGWRVLGFVTRSDFADLPPGVGTPAEVAVYLPMSYQHGRLYRDRAATSDQAGRDVARGRDEVHPHRRPQDGRRPA